MKNEKPKEKIIKPIKPIKPIKTIVYFDIRGSNLNNGNRYKITFIRISLLEGFSFIPDDKIEVRELSEATLEDLGRLIKEEDYVISDKYYRGLPTNIKIDNTLYNELGLETNNANQISILRAFRTIYKSGVLMTRTEMITYLLKKTLGVILKTGGIIIQIIKYNNLYKFTACWFSVTIDSYCKKLGCYEKDFEMDCYTYSKLGEILMEMETEITKSGMSTNNLKGYTLTEGDVEFIKTLFSEEYTLSDLPEYISDVKEVQSDLVKIANLNKKDITLKKLQRWYTREQTRGYNRVATEVFELLEKFSKKLRLQLDSNGLFYGVTNFPKDFNKDKVARLSSKHYNYGLIVDCEGTVDEGCREFGAIIFCKVGNVLVNVEEYKCTEANLVSTIDKIFKDYTDIIERYIPSTGITTYVYGPNDKRYILNSLGGKKNKGYRRNFDNKCNFIDVSSTVKRFMHEQESYKLGDIADKLNVVCYTPKHDPLNDCRTLFNVLAYLMMSDIELPTK